MSIVSGTRVSSRASRCRAARRENAPSEVQQETGESGYSVTFANFGSDGTAFVFIDREAAPPRILLFWNR